MARGRLATECRNCGSPRTRSSRRRYENLWAAVFGVRPVKCLACGAYFPVSGRAVPTRPLHEFELPFEPPDGAELSDSTRPSLPDSGEILPRHPPPTDARLPTRKCPKCGARAARPTRGGEEPSLFRLDARVLYRCASCNASFPRTDPLRFLILLVLLSSVLGASVYFLNSYRFGKKTTNSSPRMRKDRVPKLPPPVFNKRLSGSSFRLGADDRL